MLWLVVAVLLALALGVGGYGYRSGAYGAPVFGGGVGLVLVVLLLIWLLGGVR